MISEGDYIQGLAGPMLPGGEVAVCVDGQTVLVSGAVPGDTLSVHVTAKRRGVYRGTVNELLEASGQRLESACLVADSCGGCVMQSISAEDQTEVKSVWIRDAFKASIDDKTEWFPVQVHQNRFRRRLKWFVGSDRTGLFLGFYAQASHQPVRHSYCPVTTAALNEVRLLVEKHVDLHGVQAVQAVQLYDGIHVILECESAPAAVEPMAAEGLPLQWWWRDSAAITRPVQKPVVAFHDLLPAGNRDIEIGVGPDGFVQGQFEGNRDLIIQIQQWAGKPGRITDLFCGIGNLSLPLAAACGAELFGAELNAASVRAAAKNAKALGVKAEFVVANLFEYFALDAYIGADLLILDPPRRGAKGICKRMSRLLPRKIIMISCDAAAGARDGLILQQQGYRLQALRGLDLFPCAGHVETMSLWVKS